MTLYFFAVRLLYSPFVAGFDQPIDNAGVNNAS